MPPGPCSMLQLSASDSSLMARHWGGHATITSSMARMMPEDGIAQLREFDAILLGAVGWPASVLDSISLHGLLLPIRKAFDLYANVRPHRILAGITGPLRARNFDILCIRENTEGEYSGAGGRHHQGTPAEVAVETSIFTRRGVERILRFGFEQARRRRKKLASVTKSNAQKYSMVFWDEITEIVASDYPDVAVTRYHIDAIAARFVMQPESLDVVVASNLFGDILTDIGAAIQGGLGFAASANLNPAGGGPSMFEPVHGSAPPGRTRQGQSAGYNLVGALMLEHLGEHSCSRAILEATERGTAAGIATPDQGAQLQPARLRTRLLPKSTLRLRSWASVVSESRAALSGIDVMIRPGIIRSFGILEEPESAAARRHRREVPCVGAGAAQGETALVDGSLIGRRNACLIDRSRCPALPQQERQGDEAVLHGARADENRHGLLVDPCLTLANSHAERGASGQHRHDRAACRMAKRDRARRRQCL
ncbi:tartrate dehydrogenase [Bradyrhizobium sp. GM24.11]